MRNPNLTRILLIIGVVVLSGILIYILLKKNPPSTDSDLKERIEELNGRVIGLEQEVDENNQVLYRLAKENDSLVTVTRNIQQVQILVKHQYDKVPAYVLSLDDSALVREFSNFR